MTIRTKTQTFPFDTLTTTLASATTHTFATRTIFIPETSSRTILEAVLVFGVMDAQATAFSTTAITAGVTLGAAAISNQAFTTSPPANSGEHKTLVLTRDVTAYFVTNFGAGASQTCGCTYINTGGTTVNISARLVITYSWDDAAQVTRIKSARIPLESTTAGLTATLANVGSLQIPNLDTYLEEAGKTYRDIWFEIEGNDYSLGPTNDPTLNFRIDAGGVTHSTGAFFTDLASARSFRYIWNIGTGGFTTNATHDLQMSASTITAAATFNHLSVFLCVNYEYNHSTSTRSTNSITLFGKPVAFPGANAAADETRTVIEFYIEEPGTITLKQSAVQLHYTAQGAVTVTLDIGAQAERTYTDAALLYCGETSLMQRIDGGSPLGAAITLARGKNTLLINSRIGTVGTNPTGFNFVLHLNYSSDISSQGDGAHNHTTYWHIADQYTGSGTGFRTIAALSAVSIPETNYYINNLASVVKGVLGFANNPNGVLSVDAEINSGEPIGDGWTDANLCYFAAEGELGQWNFATDIGAVFKKYPTEPSNLDIEASRRWRINSSHSAYASLGLMVTYHTITSTIAGNVSGFAGTVTISAHKSTGEKIAETTRAGDGAFSIKWYDNTGQIRLDARGSTSGNGSSQLTLPVLD